MYKVFFFVVWRRKLNTFLFPAHLLNSFGVLFLALTIFHLQIISQICLGIGWMVLIRWPKIEFALAFQRYVGQYRIVETILFLIDLRIFISCRLSICLPIGFSYGLIFCPRTSENLWLLGLPDSWWSLRVSSPSLRGSFLDDSRRSGLNVVPF